MKAIRRFTVRAVLPERLRALASLGFNLRWAWDPETRQLFADVDEAAWEASGHDPIRGLGLVPAERLAELAEDDAFVARAEARRDALQHYLAEDAWYQSLDGEKPAGIALFSPEFGITGSFPQYAGGLGVLSGDMLKAASDLGVPMIGVGLFYRGGYLHQRIGPDGWQIDEVGLGDPDGMPLTTLRRPDGSPVELSLALPDDYTLRARVLVASVGRSTLLLLDADIDSNPPSLRHIADRLYGGSAEQRLLQQLLLGIGGVRALMEWAELTESPVPEVFHLNSSFGAFAGLELVSGLIGVGLSVEEAVEVVRSECVFTVQVNGPGSADAFPIDLVQRYIAGDLLPALEAEQVLAIASAPPSRGDDATPATHMNTTVLATKLAGRVVAVSPQHERRLRASMVELWPGFDGEELPIHTVLNGVHAPSWRSPAVAAASGAGDASLWRARCEERALLVTEVRRRLVAAWEEENPGVAAPIWVSQALDPDVLTVGFARRVPGYKRLTLMLNDEDRLAKLLTHPKRPIQLVVAGKAHPADAEGKRMIQRLVRFSQRPDVRGRIVFVPDYGIDLGLRLTRGSDVWLNTPLRGEELCGTSGMKAALSGGLNLSALAGWWDGAFDGENGWALPSAEGLFDAAERDVQDAAALYDIVQHQLAPLFYDRDETGVPRAWCARIGHAIDSLSELVDAERMMSAYAVEHYVPQHRRTLELTGDAFAALREFTTWRSAIAAAWPDVEVLRVEAGRSSQISQIGDTLRVRAFVHLGDVAVDDVSVQLLYGWGDTGTRIAEPQVFELVRSDASLGVSEEGTTVFEAGLVLEAAGSFGYTVRVVPRHPELTDPAELGLVAYATE